MNCVVLSQESAPNLPTITKLPHFGFDVPLFSFQLVYFMHIFFLQGEDKSVHKVT